MNRRSVLLAGLPIAAFFAVFLFYPVWHVVEGAFVLDGSVTLQAFRLAFANDVLRASVTNSLMVATVVTALCTLVSLPLAQLFVRRSLPGKAVLQALLLSGLVLPPFVAGIGLRQLLARFGSINLALLDLGLVDRPIDFLGAHPYAGVILLEVLHLYPILFLNMAAALANLDPALEEAAQSVGAGRWRRLRRVTLPLLVPGWFAGAVIVFIFAFTDLGAPIVFEVRDLVPMQIFQRALTGSREPVGYALVLVSLAVSAGLFLLGRRLVARTGDTAAVKGASLMRERPLSGPGRLVAWPLLALLIGATLLPHLAIAATAFSDRWAFSILPQHLTTEYFGRVLSDETSYLGVKNSLLYASCATGLDLVLGVTVAWLAVRKRSRLGAALDAAAMLPLALPGIVLAFGYVNGFHGPLLDPGNPFLLIVCGYALRRLPYVARAADAGFRAVPVALEEAARNLGARPRTVLARITLPLLLGNLLAGGLLAFSFAMLEVSESLILAQQEKDFPIAKAIYFLMGDIADGPAVASAMGVLGTLILLYALLVAGRLLGRSLGELFRA